MYYLKSKPKSSDSVIYPKILDSVIISKPSDFVS